MQAQGGLLSEFTYRTEPEREHFPMRNRIVAGLSDALVVVETGRRGGSLITVQFAEEYRKKVFAFPGRITDKTAEGCNLLIKTQRAALIESATDIAGPLGWEEQGKTSVQQIRLFEDLSTDEEMVLHLLRQHEQLGVDQLGYEARLSSSILAATLLELECKGLVKTLPGKRYTLK
jgi:DNA processing protein